ncbi:MAG: ornithine decarboxylase SpeF [Haemophilus parainfluenzae]|jgi:ornithine decarboxylase|uniref:Ornithine decarboxylase SpeF n=1 Tax=Haemophilus parainfluenzae HK2019 TaxID=1095746 RepID=A0ABN0EXL1_HAEPA|nr:MULTISPECIES: ornithine decarboxylase SpeF [Haemophilus]EIF35829.1 ornithine decarboxylase SpeF [Haemophilus parainfluenzae HK262]EIJ31771.1 ornithine decarboxylase SpeF [Haemophilus parainfluenzae HK2019]MBS5085716.1 ornithine decarboxylase SpeF [Haemophilus parainfluenzae]MBS6190523.1 ornithine decarboxylase SpeF [Haemophilus parainfluenzae]MBS7202749.1 ornithine decarboxylase SpeF [Haemophilus parainfluenzae]
MPNLKIAYSPQVEQYFSTHRELVEITKTDFTDVSAIVLTSGDVGDYLERIQATNFGIPVFVVQTEEEQVDPKFYDAIYHIQDLNGYDIKLYSRQIETAAKLYEEKMLPPFFKMLSEYVEMGNIAFDCPGHQGGQYYRKHPAGRFLYDFYGENIFRSDICNADVKLGDLLIHEGAACDAQKYAAQVFNADKTYFVLNGTSSSNKVALNAVLAPGDLVLFDRNNHKSNHHGALIQAGATPIYLETARNPFGFIGGIDSHCFEEDYLKSLIKEVAPEKLNQKRPFRLAVIQLGTYDGTIYNARQVVDKIGHLCDYILFDSAWVGYEQFIPMMKDCSPLLLELNENDPGILVTQSVHKQQAGFSQTSQIHKKDKHIKGQDRYVNHKRFNNAFMLHASTSPFYPLFAALDVNAKIQGSEAGRRLWHECVKVGIEARKLVLNHCELIRPFIPTTIKGKKWQDYDTEEIATNLEFFKFHPTDTWHKFEGYADEQYFVDPCKFLLTTPGISLETGEYEKFGVPATILANYLRENGIIPEKCDLNSILFLLTPAETLTKMQTLVAQIALFEKHIKQDSLLKDVLPTVYKNNEDRYKGYTIRQLCQEMHDLYVSRNVKQLQKDLFRKATLPEYALNPHDANIEFVRNKVELVSLTDIVGRVAAEGALPYPPGVLCVVPGERWSPTAQKYFLALEEGINTLPGFAPEIQGVYLQKDPDGRTRAYGYVLTDY